ncbi:DJ-1/PfpI/YhbO family deglycase/protease [Segniliparus rugosus]|nr:DJ-1/PfpI/YhbO family deglycase/protease [Segniliparus rugosus]
MADKRVLFITAQVGVERDELLVPLERLRASGAATAHAAPRPGQVQTWLNDVDHDVTVTAGLSLDDARAQDYDALVVPGGTVNADNLRALDPAVRLVRDFARDGKPIALVCHAPWLLVEADLLPGKTLTSYHSIRSDIVNAGGDWTDQPVVLDEANGWPLITSRNPGDLEDFSSAIIEALSGR